MDALVSRIQKKQPPLQQPPAPAPAVPSAAAAECIGQIRRRAAKGTVKKQTQVTTASSWCCCVYTEAGAVPRPLQCLRSCCSTLRWNAGAGKCEYPPLILAPVQYAELCGLVKECDGRALQRNPDPPPRELAFVSGEHKSSFLWHLMCGICSGRKASWEARRTFAGSG